MDNLIKAIIAGSIVNVITGSPLMAMSIGWLVYFYVKQKEAKDDTLT
jgi:hypothetical protein